MSCGLQRWIGVGAQVFQSCTASTWLMWWPRALRSLNRAGFLIVATHAVRASFVAQQSQFQHIRPCDCVQDETSAEGRSFWQRSFHKPTFWDIDFFLPMWPREVILLTSLNSRSSSSPTPSTVRSWSQIAKASLLPLACLWKGIRITDTLPSWRCTPKCW